MAILCTHGQGAFIYPGAVIKREDPGLSALHITSHRELNNIPCSLYAVGTPADVGIPFEEVKLQTKDGIQLKAYVMVQTKSLSGVRGARSMQSSAATDEEVSPASQLHLCLKHRIPTYPDLLTSMESVVCNVTADVIHVPRKRGELRRRRGVCCYPIYEDAM